MKYCTRMVINTYLVIRMRHMKAKTLTVSSFALLQRLTKHLVSNLLLFGMATKYGTMFWTCFSRAASTDPVVRLVIKVTRSWVQILRCLCSFLQPFAFDGCDDRREVSEPKPKILLKAGRRPVRQSRTTPLNVELPSTMYFPVTAFGSSFFFPFPGAGCSVSDGLIVRTADRKPWTTSATTATLGFVAKSSAHLSSKPWNQ